MASLIIWLVKVDNGLESSQLISLVDSIDQNCIAVMFYLPNGTATKCEKTDHSLKRHRLINLLYRYHTDRQAQRRVRIMRNHFLLRYEGYKYPIISEDDFCYVITILP